MKEFPISSSDPRLTAFALGELDAAEVPEFEAAVRANPALRAEVEEIRVCAAAMEDVLSSEPAVNRAESPAPVQTTVQRPRREGRMFPLFYYVAGGLAAAGFFVIIALNWDELAEKERRRGDDLRVALERRDVGQRGDTGSTIVALEIPPEATAPGMVAPRRSRESFVLTPDFGNAAATTLRRYLAARSLPPRDAVRVAELINAVTYRLPRSPAAGGEPLAAALEVGEAPWAPDRRLVRIGVRGRESTLAEARQGILDGITRSQATIAREVKVQVEFNPAQVATYRLIGREGEAVTRESPIDELARADEMIAGQAFTALYEIVPAASLGRRLPTEPRSPSPFGSDAGEGNLLVLRLQFSEPAGPEGRMLEFSLAEKSWDAEASTDFRMAAAAAQFAEVLQSQPTGGAALREVLARAASASASPADDPDGRRAEFLDWVRLAQQLME